MADVFNDSYWENEFKITQDDLTRIENRISECCCAISLTDLTRSLVVGRLTYGEDFGAPVLFGGAEQRSVRLWDPAGIWKVGDGIIVIQTVSRDPDCFDAFIGQVIKFEEHPTNGEKYILVYIDEKKDNIKYQLLDESDPKTDRQRRNVNHVANKKYRSRDLNERAQGIILRHDRVSSRLKDALEHDEHFLVLENRWFLSGLIRPVPEQLTVELHKRLLRDDVSASTAELLDWLEEKLPQDDIGLFSLYAALLKDDRGRFINEELPSRPVWRAVNPPPPPWNQAVAHYYSYDPDTYRILTCPGKPLNQRAAERLQALNYYADLVERAPLNHA